MRREHFYWEEIPFGSIVEIFEYSKKEKYVFTGFGEKCHWSKDERSDPSCHNCAGFIILKNISTGEENEIGCARNGSYGHKNGMHVAQKGIILLDLDILLTKDDFEL